MSKKDKTPISLEKKCGLERVQKVRDASWCCAARGRHENQVEALPRFVALLWVRAVQHRSRWTGRAMSTGKRPSQRCGVMKLRSRSRVVSSRGGFQRDQEQGGEMFGGRICLSRQAARVVVNY